MKKITIHQYDSVSEFFFENKKEIKEVKYLSNNRTKKYVYNENDPVFNSLISLFVDDPLTLEVKESKKRTINEYRQNKDSFYSLAFN